METKLLKENKGSTTNILILVSLLVVVFVGILFFRSSQKDEKIKIDTDEKITEEGGGENINKKMLSIVNDFIGSPYIADPLNEVNIYTEDGFNSTTLVLSLVSKTFNDENPEEIMKKINYYPPSVVKYENRNHFSTYRNKVSLYFNDITRDIGGDYVKTKNVILNREKDDGKRLIDINWEREIDIEYIEIEHIHSIITNLPSIVGVMFVQNKDEEIGLDVRGEGIITEGKYIVYASSKEGKVVKVDFIEYIEGTKFDGVVFYEFVDINQLK